MGLDKRYPGVAVAILLLSTSLAGCLDDNPRVGDEPSGEIQLGGIDTVSVDKDGEKVWNVVMVVSSEDFEGNEDVSWEQIHLDLIALDGFVNGFDLRPLNGPIPLELGAKLILEDPNSEFVHEGDMIIIHGVGKELEGGSVELFRGSTLLVEMDLPIQFSPEIDVTLAEPVMGAIVYPGTVSFTYETEVTGIEPSNATLPWWTLRLCISSPSGDFADLSGILLEDPGVEWYDSETDPPHVEWWYVEDPTNGSSGPGMPDTLDEGDSIKITGLSEDFEGAAVTLLKGEDTVWNGTIPNMPMVLQLGSPVVEHVYRNQSLHWNVSVPVDDVDPDCNVSWSSVWVRIRDREDEVTHDEELLGQDTGRYLGNVSVHWNDTDLDGSVTTDDQIVIRGLDLTFQGGRVDVFRNQTLLGSVGLPEGWPIAYVRIYMTEPHFTNRTVEGVKYWDSSFNITSVVPDSLVIPWEDIEVRIVDRSSHEVLIPLTHPELFEYEHRTVPTIFYYEGGEPDYIDHKDLIVLSGLNLTFEDSYLEFYLDGELVGAEWLEGPFDPRPPTILLSSPILTRYDINGTLDFRVVINTNKITPRTAEIPWTQLQVRVLNSTGHLLVPMSGLMKDTGVYDLNETDGIDIGLFYISIRDSVYMGAGDSFKFTGFTTAFESAEVEFYYQGRLIGSTTLPTEFP